MVTIGEHGEIEEVGFLAYGPSNLYTSLQSSEKVIGYISWQNEGVIFPILANETVERFDWA